MGLHLMRLSRTDEEKSRELWKWRGKFETARQHWDSALFDERELIYNGTHDVDANINSPTPPEKRANNVHNIVYEFVESVVDVTIPQPSVRPKRKADEPLARMIENSAENDLEEMEIEQTNDENERITSVQGFSIFEVIWDPDYKHHLHRGEIKVRGRHPKTLIPQPGVHKIQEMDYFFLLSSVTKSYVKKRYGVTLGPADTEEYPEINQFHAGQGSITGDNEKVTVITVYYRDEDNDIGRFAWTNDTVLEDLPKFFYRRLERCTKCGAVKGFEDECQALLPLQTESGIVMEVLCGNREYETHIEETEVLSEPVVTGADENGNPIVIPAGTEVPYFLPTRYPVIIRRNIPVNFQLGGQSDVDVIRDQADAIKKIVSRIEEKILRGGGVIKALDDHRFNLTNELYQVIRGNPAQLAALDVKNLTADIASELEVARYMYKAAQDTLGITNTWQGKEDATAQSGVAKQIQVEQASGRMQSKIANKYAAFKELFEIMFEFKLAYYDELRPYMTKGPTGQTEYGEFDKYRFLVQDATGKWYYNTDFLFTASGGDGFPKDRMWIARQAAEDFASGAIDKVGLWTIRESLNFPNAAEMKQAAIEEREMMLQQAQAQSMPQLSMPEGGVFGDQEGPGGLQGGLPLGEEPWRPL